MRFSVLALSKREQDGDILRGECSAVFADLKGLRVADAAPMAFAVTCHQKVAVAVRNGFELFQPVFQPLSAFAG